MTACIGEVAERHLATRGDERSAKRARGDR